MPTTLPVVFDHPLAKLAMLLVYVALSTYGLYQLKSASPLSVMFLIGFGCYGTGFLLWMVLLKALPLSVAFPTAAGGLIIATQLTGYFFLGETLRANQWWGLALMFAALGFIYWPATSS